MFFFLGCFSLRPTVFAVEYRGSAAYRKAEFSETLKQAGVSVGKRIDANDLANAKTALLSTYPTLYFVSVEKSGFRVTVTAETAFPKGALVFPTVLTAPERGVVARVKVMRGKAEVSVGDVVEAGDRLISGVLIAGEESADTYVIGEVVLLCRYTESVLLSEKREDLPALMLACSLQKKNVETPIDVETAITEESGGFLHTVTYAYALAVRGG